MNRISFAILQKRLVALFALLALALALGFIGCSSGTTQEENGYQDQEAPGLGDTPQEFPAEPTGYTFTVSFGHQRSNDGDRQPDDRSMQLFEVSADGSLTALDVMFEVVPGTNNSIRRAFVHSDAPNLTLELVRNNNDDDTDTRAGVFGDSRFVVSSEFPDVFLSRITHATYYVSWDGADTVTVAVLKDNDEDITFFHGGNGITGGVATAIPDSLVPAGQGDATGYYMVSLSIQDDAFIEGHDLFFSIGSLVFFNDAPAYNFIFAGRNDEANARTFNIGFVRLGEQIPGTEIGLTAAPDDHNEVEGEYEGKTVYFFNNIGWETVSVYVWQPYEQFAAWPGLPCEYLGDGWWGIYVPLYRVGNFIIFNNGGAGLQTNNLLLEEGKIHFFGCRDTEDGSLTYAEANEKFGNAPTVQLENTIPEDWVDRTPSEPEEVLTETPDQFIQYPGLQLAGLNMTIGSNESERNFTWQSGAEQPGFLTLWTTNEDEARTFYAEAGRGTSAREGFSTNKVTVTGLQAGVTYYYRVSNVFANGDVVESSVYRFTTDECTLEFSFMFVADAQMRPGSRLEETGIAWQQTLDYAFAAFPHMSFIATGGDNVSDADSIRQWDAFLSPAQLRTRTLAPTNGNHDFGNYGGDGVGERLARFYNYYTHFHVPNRSPYPAPIYGGGNYWYTFGNTLFIHLNAAVVQQHQGNFPRHWDHAVEFMEHAIENFIDERGQHPAWTIVLMHHSAYAVFRGSSAETLELRAALANDIFRLDIDLVLNGHEHVMARTFMMLDMNNPVIDSPNYVGDPRESGSGFVKQRGSGETLYVTVGSASTFTRSGITDFPFTARAFVTTHASFARVDVTADSLTITHFRSDRPIADDSIMDVFTIYRERP
ncbi:MAG: starch-binding protein [Defluviitaleaceae bacterium]|nr:starch-binding protein [Defluviitaleaceae bacterium]